MEHVGYKLSEPAARAAMGLPAFAQERAPMAINAQALATARTKPRGGPSPFAMDAATIFEPYKFPAETYPDSPDFALDSCLPPTAAWTSAWAGSSLFHEGQGFFGYPYLAELVQRAEYRHACEIWAEHAVRKWIKLVGGTDAERKAIEDEFTRLQLRDVFQEWMFHDHVFGRAQVFLDFGDANDPAELETPLLIDEAKIGAKRPLLRLTVVEPMWSAPGTYNTSNPLDGDFYVPRSWFIYGKRVDTSRMLTLSSRPVSDMLKPAYAFGGQSLVQLMKPYVDNWLRGRQSASDLLNSFSIINLATDMASTMAGGNGDSLFNRVDMFNLMRDNRGAMVTDKNAEELSNLAVPLSSVPELVSQAQEQLASVARIPLSIYLQITPTGLNATSDGETRNFYADVKAYQEKNIRPHLQRVFEIVQLSVGGKINPEIKFEFEPLWEMDDKDLADIRKADADAHAQYVLMGAVSNDEVRETLANDESGLYHGVDLGSPAPVAPGVDDDDEDEDEDISPGEED